MQGGYLAAALTTLALAASAVGGCALAPSQPAIVTAFPAARPSTTPAVTITPQPTPTPALSWTWTRLDRAQFAGDGPSQIVGLPDGRLLAVNDPSTGSKRLTFWRSADGLSWTRLPDAAAFQPSGADCTVTVHDVERTLAGLVAVGDESCWDSGRATALAWTSVDGLAWRRASVDGAAGRSIGQVVQTAEGLVALGDPDVVLLGQDFSKPGTAEWTSADGKAWRRVPAAEGPPAGVGIGSVVAFQGSYFGLTVGRDATIWSSSDAVRWQLVAGSPNASGLQPFGALLLAFGPQVEQAVPLVWASADGVAWSEVSLPRPVVPVGAVAPDEDPSMVTVGADGLLAVPGGGLLAFGWRSDGRTDFDTVAWASPDGISWSAVALPISPHFLLQAACAAGSSVLLQGFYMEELPGDDHTVLLGIPPSP